MFGGSTCYLPSPSTLSSTTDIYLGETLSDFKLAMACF